MSTVSPTCLRLANKHTGEVLELTRRRRNGEVVLELRGTLPPHEEGPPRHIHHLEDEECVVIAGVLSADVGGKRVDVGVGERVLLPRDVPHRWWNQGDSVLALEGQVRPAVDLDRYMEAVFEVMNAGPRNRPPLFYIAHVALRHRHTQTVLIMSPPLQTVLFRAVRALGTILGRYRGNEWPGCPARCVGAPTVGADS